MLEMDVVISTCTVVRGALVFKMEDVVPRCVCAFASTGVGGELGGPV